MRALGALHVLPGHGRRARFEDPEAARAAINELLRAEGFAA
jgi:hypothetical protein